MFMFRAPRFDTKMELLRRCPALAGWSRHELARIARAGDLATLPSDCEIVNAGHRPSWVYLILAGETVSVEGGIETRLGEGRFIGDLAALARCPSRATIRTLSRVDVIAFRAADYLSLFDAMPRPLNRALHASLSDTTGPAAQVRAPHRSRTVDRCLSAPANLPG